MSAPSEKQPKNAFGWLKTNKRCTKMAQTVPQSRELLIKEVKYRASYRGTLELDVVCRSLLPKLEEFDDSELAAIAQLLQQKEGDLMTWLVDGGTPPEEFALTVALVRHVFKESRKKAS